MEASPSNTGSLPVDVLNTFNAFAFDAPSTPVGRNTRRESGSAEAAASRFRPAGEFRTSRGVPCGKRRNSSSMPKRTSYKRKSISGTSPTTAPVVAAAPESDGKSHDKIGDGLPSESDLSLSVRESLEWLATAEQRRNLSSAEVAASFQCPLCHRFGMQFRSGRYGVFLGCSEYPQCKGKISDSKVQRWRSCTGDKNSGLCVVFEIETPHTFRIHPGGCATTGELLAHALPRIIQTAARLYTQQQQQQQQQHHGGTWDGASDASIPEALRPLSWLPRSDCIRKDPTLLSQFSSAAVLHHARKGKGEEEGERPSSESTPPQVLSEQIKFSSNAGVLNGHAASAGEGTPSKAESLRLGVVPHEAAEGKNRLRFVDWTCGALKPPADGLRYTDGCVFSLDTYPIILQAAAAVCGWARLIPIPGLTLRFFRDTLRSGQFLVTSKERALRVAWWMLPPKLREHLLPFQWEGVVFAVQRGGRALIGDEMGLGKTVQAIACIALYRQFPCLIVVPASMRLVWADALEEWLANYSAPPQLRVLFASGDRPAPDEEHCICLSSFEMAGRLYDSLKATQYKFVVVDEAHKLRGSAFPRNPSFYARAEAAAARVAGMKAENAAEEAARVAGMKGENAAEEAARVAGTTRAEEHFSSVDSTRFVQAQPPLEKYATRQDLCRVHGEEKRRWRLSQTTSSQDANRKILDLVRGSRHALLLSGTPSVRLPADLFPLVEALLPARDEQDAIAVRARQLQQWRELETLAEAEARRFQRRDSSLDSLKNLDPPPPGVGEVPSPGALATPAWKAAAAKAAKANEAYGNPLDPARCSTFFSQDREKKAFSPWTVGEPTWQRFGNILRDERIQFAEEYCCSSRSFGSRRRFEASPRSWELHLLLTRAVLIRRRKTLRDFPTIPLPSQGAGEAGRNSPLLLEADLHAEAGSEVCGVSTVAAIAGGSMPPTGDPQATLRDAESLIEGLPWAADASGDCDALVLPRCMRIVQLLLIFHCNNKLLTAIGEGLVLQKPEYRSLRSDTLKTAAGGVLLSEDNSISSDKGITGTAPVNADAGLSVSTVLLDLLLPSRGELAVGLSSAGDLSAALRDVTRRPPATPAERVGLCKVAAAAQWLQEKFFRDVTDSAWHGEGADPPPKVIVFAHHRRVMDALGARLRELRVSCCLSGGARGLRGEQHGRTQGFVRIDGSLPEEERQRRRRIFLTDPRCLLALISITSSSHGLDFSGASVCIFLELLPPQHELLQAEARLHRRGQGRTVTTYFLVGRCKPSVAAAPRSESSHCTRANALRSSASDFPEEEAEAGASAKRDACELLTSLPGGRGGCAARRIKRDKASFLEPQGGSAPPLSFADAVKKCCLHLQREVEAVDEAAWCRIVQQAALVQQTLDGPLSAASQLDAVPAAAATSDDMHLPASTFAPASLTSASNSLPERQEQHAHPTETLEQIHQPTSCTAIRAEEMTSLHARIPPPRQADKTTSDVQGMDETSPGYSLLQDQQAPCVALLQTVSPAVSEAFRFRVSRFTQRVHAFKSDPVIPLGVSFTASELCIQQQPPPQLPEQQQQGEELPEKLQAPSRHTDMQQMKACDSLLLWHARHAAYHYRRLFGLLSSFDQRRMREAALTVQELLEFVKYRYAALQQDGEKKISSVSDDARLSSCNSYRDSLDSWSRVDSRGSHHDTSCLSVPLDEPQSSNAVSSRYFSTPSNTQPSKRSLEGASASHEKARRKTQAITFRPYTREPSRSILIPVILDNPRVKTQLPAAPPKHMQPFCRERQTVLCVSCMKPICSVSTSRTYLRIVENTEESRIPPLQPESAKPAGIKVSDQLAVKTLQSGAPNALRQTAEPQTQLTVDLSAHVDWGEAFGKPQSSVEVVTSRQNFANDETQCWLIRCSEQDLTCSGRCSDAYAARRRRQALRRQVERCDNGVCSHCGLDCGEMLTALKVMHAAGEPQWRIEEEVTRRAPSFRPWPALIRKLACSLTPSCAWEADHRKPVKDGGGLATVDSVQTLCRACHLEKTIEEGRRGQKRRHVGTNEAFKT
ncbi:uncharacterized protein LOC34621132 [Cyclospora cayetanensis]|uniref:Uncharacterized protein LOC34621132 n=1 Tax=Cyclospora cayetanensis TaxID=88456 RepID=A0A6P6RSP2_9EIME|nr:uncharacterized protein LOC34621132 [Cyclospora cayetanensis]